MSEALIDAARLAAKAIFLITDEPSAKEISSLFIGLADAISDLTRQIASRDEVAAGLHEEIDKLRVDIGTVIRDNDEKMAEIARLKKALQVIAGKS